MAEKHIVKFHFIAKFFGDGNRFLVRGENAFTSGHVTKFRFDGTVQPMRISAEVLPSMKKLNYTVEISYDLEEGVKTAHCTCPRGNVACHHMAAALYYAHYNVSATDIECQWSAPSKQHTTEVIKLTFVLAENLVN
nr:PREDICTED: uncharacterized protein LOC103313437 [Tribolium castaneum]|eukprot:XP_008194917.1 PREDICTED: uncharacterized protein LOC103313437 [Tribolium castaneum]